MTTGTVRMAAAGVVAAVVFAAVGAGCTLLVSVAGLSGGAVAIDDGGDAMVVEDGASESGRSGACPAPEPDLLVYYRFDDRAGTAAKDCSGNARDGVVVAPSWAAGKRDGALVFDGSATCLTIPDSTKLMSAGPFSITAWVSVTAYTVDGVSARARYLVSKANDVPEYRDWRLASDGPSVFSFKLGQAAGSTEAITLSGQPTATWLAVAAVFDPGQRLEVWVGGVLLTARAAPSAFVDDPLAPLRVGCLKTSSFFDGAVDELRLYGRALTPAEIQALAR